MEKIYDAVVIGAGPASAAFLCGVSDSYKIALLNKKASRKVCGGLLSPTAVKYLDKMGLQVPETVKETPKIKVIRTVDLRGGFTRYYPRNYVNVDREKFDRWLISVTQGKFDSYCGTCTGFEKDGENFRVKYFDEMGEKFLLCKSIIGGDGANSVIRRTFSRENGRKDMYIAIQQWFFAAECEGHENFNAFSCIFDNSVSDSYAWIFTKGDKIALGGAYPKADSRKRFETEKEALKKIGVTFGEPLATEACNVVFGKNQQKFLLGAKNKKIYLIGEAAGLISPSSLEGISSALKSGFELGKIFTPDENILPQYKKKIRFLKLKLRFKRVKSFVLCTPFIRFIVMRSGITAVDKKL
ncbi:MAG: FAD-binding protein [Clostridia bacterium]|nr:FAD-binding protein [Clostridia bacterium]